MSSKSFYAVVTSLPRLANSLREIDARSLQEAKQKAAPLATEGTLAVRLFEHVADGPIVPLAQLRPEDEGAWQDLVPSLVRGWVPLESAPVLN
jgi:hypothetical protein